MRGFAGAAVLLALALGCAAPMGGPRSSAPDPSAVSREDPAFRRPLGLIDALPMGALRDRLRQCDASIQATPFSIGHRGAPLGYPEHTAESYRAAANMGAGRIECDAVPTRDGTLVCRHDVCDLHETTNILETDLAETCEQPFSPAERDGEKAAARCCTSALRWTEFKSLCGRRPVVDPTARTLVDYLAPQSASPDVLDDNALSAEGATAVDCGTLMTHRESVALFASLGVEMIPELKSTTGSQRPKSISPFDLADQLLADYRDAGISPERIWPQSFEIEIVRHWIRTAPEWADQIVYLDGRSGEPLASPQRLATRSAPVDAPDPGQLGLGPTFPSLAAEGIRTIGAPIWMLLTTERADDGRFRIVPSRYARAARAAGLELIAWTIERSGSIVRNVLPAAPGASFYYLSVHPALEGEGDILRVIDVLRREVGVRGIFSDWPATTTYAAACSPDPAPPSNPISTIQ